jgi:tRNA(adenine34) deaminase
VETIDHNQLDEYYMSIAIEEAKKAWEILEVPIGAVIVHKDKIIGKGYNRRNTDKSTFAHAEIMAMQQAMKVIGDWRLEETTMYITLEPCPMCAGAIVQARIPKVVIGAMNPKAGSAGSVVNLLNEPGFNHQVELIIGILGEQCSSLLQNFFKELRELKKSEQ